MLYTAPDMPFDKPIELRIVDRCECGDPIYEGQEYYNVGGKTYCQECIENSKTFA